MFDASTRHDNSHYDQQVEQELDIAASECMVLGRRVLLPGEVFGVVSNELHIGINASHQTAVIKGKNEEALKVRHGDAFVMKKGWSTDASLDVFVLQFDYAAADDFAYQEFNQTLSTIFADNTVASGRDLADIASELETSLAATQNHWFVYVESLTRLLVVKTLQCFVNHQNKRHARMLGYRDLAAIVAYIVEHHGEDITLQTLTALTDMSTSYLSRQFKRYLDTSPMYLVNNYRIEKAKYRLRTEAKTSVADIAFSVGFSDHPHFGKVFKKQVGVSPGSYRKTAQKALGIAA